MGLLGSELLDVPLRVKSRHLQCKKPCPLYPRKRTFPDISLKGPHNGRPSHCVGFADLGRLRIFANAFRPDITELA